VTDGERVERLRTILAPVIAWYQQVEAEGEPDGSYLYDMTPDQFERLPHGIYQEVIEALK
jgi:hypothetical protein